MKTLLLIIRVSFFVFNVYFKKSPKLITGLISISLTMNAFECFRALSALEGMERTLESHSLTKVSARENSTPPWRLSTQVTASRPSSHSSKIDYKKGLASLTRKNFSFKTKSSNQALTLI